MDFKMSRLRFGAIPSFADTLELLKLKSFSAQNWTLIQSSEFDSFVQEEPYNAIQVLHNVITGQTLLRVWGRTVLRTRLRDRALLTQLCWQAFHKTTACHGASLGRPDMTGESKTSFYQDPSENCRSRHCELWYKSDRVKGDMCLQCLQVIAESSSDARRYAKSFVEKQEEEEDTDRRETDLQIRTKWEGEEEEEEEEEEVDTGVFQSVEAIDFDDLVQLDREQLEEIDEDCQSLGSVGDMLDSPSLSASPDFDGQDQANDDVQIETDEEIFNVRKESLIVAAFSKIKEAKKRVKVDKIKAKRRKRQSSDDAIFQISGAAAKKRRVRVTEPTIKCQLCENRFTSEIHLSRHLNQKHAYSWYTCLFCDFVARYPEDLTNHYLETEDHERPEQVSVPCCGKYFPIHLLAKHCQKCFSACHVCRKKVKQITKKIHMRHKHAAGCHQCPLCEFSALFPKEIVDHIGAVHPATDPKDVSCPQCRKGFPADKYDSHCKLGCCEGPYGWLKTVTCHICGRLVDRNMYQDHMDQSHVGVSTREMVCSTCAVRSHEVGRFLCHLRVRHAYAVYRCVRCRFVCGLPEELVKHCKEAHEKCPAAECPKCCDDIALASFGEHVAVCVAKWNTCKECGKGFTTTKGLDKHLNLSVSCGKARCTFCDVCGKEVSKATLNSHMKRHEENEEKGDFQCKDCGIKFDFRKRLDRHVFDIHTKPETEVFKTNTLRGRHENEVHGIPMPFYCDQCGIGFLTSNFLASHVKRKHTENKEKFECKICGAKLSQKSALDRHMWIHDNITPYRCKYCNHGFKAPWLVRRHAKAKHKEEYAAEEEAAANHAVSDRHLKKN